MKKLLLFSLCVLLNYSYSQIGLNKDSLLQIFNTSNNDSSKVKTAEILLTPFYVSDQMETEKIFKEAVTVCEKNNFYESEISLNVSWSAICEMSARYEEAVVCQKKAAEIALKTNNLKKLKEILQHVLHYRTETLKALRDKERITKQRNQAYVLSAIIILILLIIIITISRRSLRKEKRQKNEITSQRDLIENQKHLVEEKQKEILDSIHYAKRIQTALITSEKYIDKNLNKLQKD